MCPVASASCRVTGNIPNDVYKASGTQGLGEILPLSLTVAVPVLSSVGNLT